MAEWLVIGMLVVVCGIAYFAGRFVTEPWQTIAVWCIAGVIISAGLIGYVYSKVGTAKSGWIDHYNIEIEP